MNIVFVESIPFSKKVDSFLNEDEQDGLRFVLAARPLSGKPSAANENILEILFAGYYVSYVIDSTGKEIFLINIAAAPTPVPTPEEKSKLNEIFRKWLPRIIIVRRVWEFIREHWPFDWPPPWDDFF